MPQYSITPGGIEGDGDHLLVPLDAVDGQLPVCGVGAHGGRVAHRVKDGGRRQDAGQDGQSLSPEQNDFWHGYSLPLLPVYA